MQRTIRLLLIIAFCFGYLAQAEAQTKPEAPATSAVTEAQLKRLIAEKERVVIVQDTTDTFLAIKASSVGSVTNTTIEVPKLTALMIIENKVIVVGGTPHTATKKDLVEAVMDNWHEPFDTRPTYWSLTGREPAEMIQIAMGKFAEPKKFEVKSIVTWWCPREGPDCKSPKN